MEASVSDGSTEPTLVQLVGISSCSTEEPDRLIALDGELQTHGIACNDAGNTSINDAIALVVLAPRSAAVEVMMLSVARPSDGPGRERPSVRRVGHRGCWFEESPLPEFAGGSHENAAWSSVSLVRRRVRIW